MSVIATLSPDARPRERLAAVGAEHLSDAELLAVVFGSGTRGACVMEVADAVLRACGGLAGLALAADLDLRVHAGVGPVRAAVVRAALELGRRAAAARPRRGQRLAGASEVWTYFRARLAPLRIEEFWAVALDVRHRIEAEFCLARGSLTGVEVHPRDVFRPLIRCAAAAVIFCHNHPSGAMRSRRLGGAASEEASGQPEMGREGPHSLQILWNYFGQLVSIMAPPLRRDRSTFTPA